MLSKLSLSLRGLAYLSGQNDTCHFKRETHLILIIWEFLIKPEKRAEFEQYYAAEGHWAELFRQSPAYQGTTLAQDIARPVRYLVTDVWENLEAFYHFKQSFGDDYERLDKLCEQFTEEERHLGIFQIEQSFNDVRLNEFREL
jgi:heme-degrading monooxygenase HmoA